MTKSERQRDKDRQTEGEWEGRTWHALSTRAWVFITVSESRSENHVHNVVRDGPNHPWNKEFFTHPFLKDQEAIPASVKDLQQVPVAFSPGHSSLVPAISYKLIILLELWAQ